MSQSNRDRVDRELERLNRSLKPFIVGRMSSMYGTSWQQEAEKSLSKPHWTREGGLRLDTPALLYILRDQWESIFHQALRPVESNMISGILGVRNKWAHQDAITDADVQRLLKYVEHLLNWIGPTDSFSQPPLTQANTTRSTPRPVIQTPPQWQDLHSSPRPARTPGQPLLSRRAMLIIAIGVAALGVPILCELSQRGQYLGQPDQTDPTAMTPEPTSISRPLFTYTGHAKSVNAVAWSPDGKRVASGSDDTTVQVWNVSNGSHIFTYHGHTDAVNTVAWSPDGRRIASGSGDLEFTGDVQVWNASNGGQAFTYTGQSEDVETVAWSPDGRRIASGSFDNTVQVWNASDGSHMFTYQGHSGWVNAVAWSPNGRWIASGSWDNTVQVWNASDGTHVFTYTGHSNVVTSVAWSPDSKRIASGSWDDTVQVWNASDGSDAFTYTGHSDNVYAVAWSPDGSRIASGSRDTTVQVWQAV